MEALVITATRAVNGLKSVSVPSSGSVDSRTPRSRRGRQHLVYLTYVIGALTTGSLQAGPAILAQPENQRVLENSPASLGVVAEPGLPVHYQWFFQGAILPGATNSWVTIPSVRFSDAGDYFVTVSNSLGAATSSLARVTVGFGLKVAAKGRGTVVASPALSVYEAGARLRLEAVPDTGRSFVTWSGAVSTNSNPVELTMNGHLSVTAEFAPLLPGDLLWTFDAGTAVISCPALGADGTVYIGSLGGVDALDRATGAKQRKLPAAGDYFQTSPALGMDGTLYALSWNGKLYAFDADTGVQKWVFVTEAQVGTSSPAVGSDGTVYVGGYYGKVYALDGANGAVKWAFTTGDQVRSSPALGTDGTVYVGSFDKHVYALDGATGAQKWTVATGGWVISSPALDADGTVYVGSLDKHVYALDGATGARKWTFVAAGPIRSSPAIGLDGTVYVGSDDGKLYALDGRTGAQKWAFVTGGYVSSSPAIGADGTVYVGSADKNIYALDRTTGARKWAFATGYEVESSPTIGPDGTVYVGSGDGKLYALQGSAGLARSPWPKFHRNVGNTGTSTEDDPLAGPPALLLEPVDDRFVEHTTATLITRAEGSLPLSYQWFFGDDLLPRATNSSLTLADVQFSNAGEYRVVVSNSLGAVTSRVARLSVGFRLTVANRGRGTTVISPALAVYDPASRVELRAVAESGRKFLRWGGDISAAANPLEVTLNGHLRVVAEFSRLPGDLLWSFEVGGGPSYPAIGPEGTIYVGGQSVFALDGGTGEKIWEFAEASGGTVVGPDGTVIVASAQPRGFQSRILKLYGLDASFGTKKWEASVLEAEFAGGWPAVGGVGLIYVTVSDSVHAFDASTGARQWSVRVADYLSSPVLGEDGTLYLTFGNTFGVCALNGVTGQQRWRVGQGGVGPERRQSPPVVGAHNVVYVGDFSPGGPPPSGYAYLHALDGATGQIKWNGPGALSYLGISENGTLFAVMGMDLFNPYFPDMVTTSLGAYYAETGQIQWGLPSWTGPPELTSAPTVAKDGTLYVAMNQYVSPFRPTRGTLKALDGGTGRTNWSFGIPDPVDGQSSTWLSGAALGPDGTVYVGCANGTLYALEGSGSGLAHSPWPTARGNPRNTGQAYTVFPRVSSPVGGGLYFEGSPVELWADAKGPAPISLQWQRNGESIPGATNAIWKISSVSNHDAGAYSVAARNAFATVISQPAAVSVYNVAAIARPVLRFTAPSGTPLQLQYVDALKPSADWQSLGDLTLPSGPYGFADPSFTTASRRFYRTTQNDPIGIQILPAWTIHAPVGSLHRIEYVDEATGLANWQHLTDLTLPWRPYLFIDLSATNGSPRHYRTTPVR